jgi:type I restriction enzyme R subunit
MRPYQVYAVQHMVKCIDDDNGNGYIWHTTGSGKTLTSFKASTLLKADPNIEKCLFVVDRKDLDRQTREEFNRFQEGSVEPNANTGALVDRLLSDDAADKVIVCTIQKLGLALDPANGRNYVDRLETLRDKRMVFIFDECHRSQFGDTYQAIKDFFQRAQMFGFTGTPIFEANASYRRVEGDVQTLRTTEDLFQQSLHEYTITHAIEDRNVLRFHVDYYKPDGARVPNPGEPLAKRAIVDTILDKHDAATGGRKFNALFATASINDAIEYYRIFGEAQADRLTAQPELVPLNIAAVFSPPADVSPDVKQIQEDLPQEQLDNRQNPEQKKQALKDIIDDYNGRFGTSHRIEEFDLYYQDIQKRIKDQQFSKDDFRAVDPDGRLQHKIDITIVVDMLLTGFDSKYLNTLYVDKNLRYHTLIQAFSRTNRVLNDTKPYGHILDFRGQQKEVDAAITLFSGADADAEQARKIWLVDSAPVVIDKLRDARERLDAFMKSQGLSGTPDAVANLKGDDARAMFVKQFKEVQRIQTQLDQYTDLTAEQEGLIQAIVPEDELLAFRGVYLETAQRLKASQGQPSKEAAAPLDQLDFEFVLFASATIDYDYIMKLIADFSSQAPGKTTMTREALIGLIAADSKFLDQRDEITEYVRELRVGDGLTKKAVEEGYRRFRDVVAARELAEISTRHGLAEASLKSFVDAVLARKIFDGEQLTGLLAPLDLGWRARTQKELALMADLVPLLKKRAGGQEIAGLKAYEE